MTWTFAAATGAAGFKARSAAASSGLPGLSASNGSLLAKPTGAGGGVRLATTGRARTAAGGALPAGAAAPITLARTGANAATGVTGALTIISFDIRTAALDTGCDCTNAVAGTAMTAPGTCWLTYVMLVTFVLLYTFVIWVLLMTVLLLLMCVK